MFAIRFLAALLALLAIVKAPMVSAQDTTHGPKPLDQFVFEKIPTKEEFYTGPSSVNLFMDLFYGQNIARGQTPLVVRWGMIYTVTQYEARAACHPKSLSFFGTKDYVPPSMCSLYQITLTWVYYLNYIYRHEFPSLGFRTTQYLLSLGMDPLSKSNNKSTNVGFANFMGARMVNYLKNDGWNSRGSPRKDFGLPFSDNTGYMPMNEPGVPETELKYPLRWQPLRQTDKFGNFFTQEHVTPHIGLTGKPLLAPRSQLMKRRTKGPYMYPNSSEIHPVDRDLIMSESRKLFRISSRLTKDKIQEAYLWDSKFYSTGIMSLVYLEQLVEDGWFNATSRVQVLSVINHFQVAESIAMHDATILAWHEKRRHDLARPQTFMRRLFSKDTKVNAFRGPGFGKGRVHAVEWEPLIQAQPHSEYPSGSAMLCGANFETMDLSMRYFFGSNYTKSIPPLRWQTPSTVAVGNPYIAPLNLTFKTAREMARRCGNSRRMAGIHFRPSIRDGGKAIKGIGKMASQFMIDIEEGRVPKYCYHCLN